MEDQATVDAWPSGLSWPDSLFPYQKEGVNRLLSEPGVLLADEMGLGKTIQVLAALRVLKARLALGPVLIVAPAGLVVQWRRQLRRWAPELRPSTVVGSAGERLTAWRANADVYLASYESVRSDLQLRSPMAPGNRMWSVVVLDEAQRIKNADSELAVSIKRLKRDRSWALTGTPLENRIGDLISILEFVAPGRFQPAAMAVGLRELLGKVQLRRRRRDVLPDLPPKLNSTICVELTSHQRQVYRRAEREGVVRLEALGRELRITHVLELILRLKQICNFCPETGASAKLSDLEGRLRSAVQAGEKALIFSQFAEAPFGAEGLGRALGALSPIVFTGGADPSTRAAKVVDFERDPKRHVMVLSLRAGGVGLNLTSASHVFHFDRWWNPAVEAQAEDRAHRIGQSRPVHVYSYLCSDTIEERIDEILEDKRALFADVIDGIDTGTLRRLDLDSLLAAVRGETRLN